MDQQTIQTYDSLAREYDQETTDFWDKFPDDVLRTFADTVGKGQVLDIGCGPGRDALLLKEHDLDITCLDASSEMVQLCAEKGFRAIKGDLLKLPFVENSFRGAWAYTSLLHIHKSQMGAALREIARVLENQGILGLGMIEGSGEEYRESSGVHLPRWFAFYTKEELEQELLDVGFKILFFHTFKPRSKNYLNFVCTL